MIAQIYVCTTVQLSSSRKTGNEKAGLPHAEFHPLRSLQKDFALRALSHLITTEQLSIRKRGNGKVSQTLKNIMQQPSLFATSHITSRENERTNIKIMELQVIKVQ